MIVIFMCGGIDMIIKKIVIENLYGQHGTKEVIFDKKVTFLFGSNGCGKTTVLNILTAIVTGKLYILTEYNFDRINLFYSDEKEKEEKIQIAIIPEKNNNKVMMVCFNNQYFEIEDVENLKERIYRKNEDESIERTFFNMYPFLENIKKKFNYVYLPLNRYGYDDLGERENYYYEYSRRRYYYGKQSNAHNSYLNDSLKYISALIRRNCMKINVQENRVNDQFRKDVLSSMIRVSGDKHLWEIVSEIEKEKFDWNEVLKSKEAYIKTLIEIGVYDKKLEEDTEGFFKSFKNAYDAYVKKIKDSNGITVDLAWQYAEFQKIRSIAELAKENEKVKEKIRKPKKLFEDLINDFFLSSGTHKKIIVNNEGQVMFETRYGKLSLENLSSGEKQLIITFASLIFGFEGRGTGIFIIDEPEASLHLEWQNKFVPAIMKTNENLQLIFATHSPEIIGEYRNKAFRLR